MKHQLRQDLTAIIIEDVIDDFSHQLLPLDQKRLVMEVYLDDTPRPPFIFGILLAKADDFVVGHILIEIVDGMLKMDVVG